MSNEMDHREFQTILLKKLGNFIPVTTEETSEDYNEGYIDGWFAYQDILLKIIKTLDE